MTRLTIALGLVLVSSHLMAAEPGMEPQATSGGLVKIMQDGLPESTPEAEFYLNLMRQKKAFSLDVSRLYGEFTLHNLGVDKNTTPAVPLIQLDRRFLTNGLGRKSDQGEAIGPASVDSGKGVTARVRAAIEAQAEAREARDD